MPTRLDAGSNAYGTQHPAWSEATSLRAARQLLALAMNIFAIALVTISGDHDLGRPPDARQRLIGGLRYPGLSNMSGVWPRTHMQKLVFMVYSPMFAIITPALIIGPSLHG